MIWFGSSPAWRSRQPLSGIKVRTLGGWLRFGWFVPVMAYVVGFFVLLAHPRLASGQTALACRGNYCHPVRCYPRLALRQEVAMTTAKTISVAAALTFLGSARLRAGRQNRDGHADRPAQRHGRD